MVEKSTVGSFNLIKTFEKREYISVAQFGLV